MVKDMFGTQEAQSPWTSKAKPGTSPLSKAISALNESTELLKARTDAAKRRPERMSMTGRRAGGGAGAPNPDPNAQRTHSDGSKIYSGDLHPPRGMGRLDKGARPGTAPKEITPSRLSMRDAGNQQRMGAGRGQYPKIRSDTQRKIRSMGHGYLMKKAIGAVRELTKEIQRIPLTKKPDPKKPATRQAEVEYKRPQYDRTFGKSDVLKAAELIKSVTEVLKAMTAGSSATTGSNLMHAVADGAKPMDKAYSRPGKAVAAKVKFTPTGFRHTKTSTDQAVEDGFKHRMRTAARDERPVPD